MKKWAAVIILLATVALGSAIKVWGPGDILSSTDLNANFAHIHTTMVGGHGARLVDADVNNSAAISHSKLATPRLVPKAIAAVSTNCTAAGACTLFAPAYRISAITRLGSAGLYRVDFSPALSDASYFPAVTCATAGGAFCLCTYEYSTMSTTSLFVDCYDATGALMNAAPGVVIYDDNN